MAAAPCQAQIKLVLKDGSYQLVKSYEVKGARVHYYSLERSDWEDIPTSLVDFPATARAQHERRLEQQKILEEAAKTEKNTYQFGQNGGHEISPGIVLPSAEGVYAYDGTRVITLLQSQGSIVRDRRRLALNIALPAPILKGRMLVILPGRAAAVRIPNQQPVFYARFADGAGANIEMLRLKAGKDRREVESMESGLRGKPSEVRSTVPLLEKQIAPGLFQLKPSQPLSPGEYALGEINQNKLNLDVWDFGIGSSKPEAR